jgi:hypothetical protein
MAQAAAITHKAAHRLLKTQIPQTQSSQQQQNQQPVLLLLLLPSLPLLQEQ